jgi:16S rRNA (uracil1498-N3)-methyltransferase
METAKSRNRTVSGQPARNDSRALGGTVLTSRCTFRILLGAMSEYRFFVSPESVHGDDVAVEGSQAHQIAHVLRRKAGQHIVLLDNTGQEYEVEITGFTRHSVSGRVVGRREGMPEPAVGVVLCQALLKADKFELVLQKGVELGVSRFWPFTCERSVAGLPSSHRLERWHSVIREAAEQCGRSVVPRIEPPTDFGDATRPTDAPSLILWEHERTTRLSALLRQEPFREAGQIRLIVGPEGGFTESEIEKARDQGIVPVGLGRRILRAETASLAALSAVMYEAGELG